MATAVTAVIVGAGPAGLATSRELARRGIDHLLLERGARVGQTWHRLHDGLVLHTGKHLSSLPGLGFPATTPLFPPRADVVAYLDRYAAAFDLPVRTSIEVTAIERDGGAWRVCGRDGSTLEAHSVVVATGIAANPWLPTIPGRAGFRGRLLHSIDYRRPGDVPGPRVLVVGGGNSAADVSTELTSAGLDVTLSVRAPLRSVPLALLGIPAQYVALPLALLPRRLQRAIVDGRWRPGAGARASRRDPGCQQVPVIGDRLRRAIEKGAIRLVPALTALTRTGARFAGGEHHTFDDVILATGFRPALACVAPARVRTDACGRALRRQGVASADAPHLYFVGQNADVRGTLFSLRRDARRTARLIARTAP